jgi:hypothetical protein
MAIDLQFDFVYAQLSSICCEQFEARLGCMEPSLCACLVVYLNEMDTTKHAYKEVT